MKPRTLYWCGVIAPLLFVFMTILGGAMRPGYSHIADSVSELMSPGSPNRFLLSAIFTAYALIMACFGVGLLRFVQRSAQPSRYAALGGWLFIAAAVINVFIATVFPQDPWGTPFTFPGMMHLILSGVIGILQVVSIALLGIWLLRMRVSPGLGTYSLLTAGVNPVLVGVFLTLAGTPLMGFAERCLILTGLLWTFVMAQWMQIKSRKANAQDVYS